MGISWENNRAARAGFEVSCGCMRARQRLQEQLQGATALSCIAAWENLVFFIPSMHLYHVPQSRKSPVDRPNNTVNFKWTKRSHKSSKKVYPQFVFSGFIICCWCHKQLKVTCTTKDILESQLNHSTSIRSHTEWVDPQVSNAYKKYIFIWYLNLMGHAF